VSFLNPTTTETACRSLLRRAVQCVSMVSTVMFAGWLGEASAQTIDSARQWNGATAYTRQPEQVIAGTMAEWRSLWARVGAQAPDVFEPGRMSAVGIFLGTRPGEGYSVHLLSAARRRDRIIVIFEERAPAEVMMAQRAPTPPAPAPAPVSRNVAGGPATLNNFAPPGSGASLMAPAPAARPATPPTSPWTILLINRADLPISVEQRWFR